jgi:hypothetical protein
MLKKRVKEMGKDIGKIGVAGVGLGAISPLAGEMGTAAPVLGTLGRGLGKVGGIVMVGHGMKILSDIVPKKKRRY